jgi:hypothetical protein
VCGARPSVGCAVVELVDVDVGVEAVALHQPFVLALLHDVAVFHDQDQVGIAHGGEVVGDDEAGTSSDVATLFAAKPLDNRICW